MFLNESLMTTVFKILNVGVLVASFVYLFRQYAVPLIRKGVSAHKKEVKALKTERTKTYDNQQQLDHDIDEQQQYGKRLLDNIDHWQKSEREIRHAIIRRNHAIEQKLVEKRKMQVQYLANTQVQESIVTEALQQAEKQLGQYFEQDHHGTVFIESITDFLGRTGS